MPDPIGSGRRPYLNASIDQLTGFVEQHRANPKELKRLLDELNHRSTPKGRWLREHCRNLITSDGQADLLAGLQPIRNVDAPLMSATQTPIPPLPEAMRPIKINPAPVKGPEPGPTEDERDEPEPPPSLQEQEACECLGVSALTDWVQIESRRRQLLRQLSPTLTKNLPESERIRRRQESDKINQAFRVLFQCRCATGTSRTNAPTGTN